MSATAPQFDRCSDCAFSAGTDASKDELTRVRARLCVDTGEIFYCHNQPERPDGEDHPCGGWVDAINKRGEAGTLLTGWKRDVSIALLEVIHAAETDPNFPKDNVQEFITKKVNEALAKYA